MNGWKQHWEKKKLEREQNEWEIETNKDNLMAPRL